MVPLVTTNFGGNPLKMDTAPSSETSLSTYGEHLRRPSSKRNRAGYISLYFTTLRAHNV